MAIWQDARGGAQNDHEELAVVESGERAQGEVFGYYLLGPGRGLAGVVMRALALDPALQPELKRHSRTICPVHSQKRDDWPSLNSDTREKLEKAASVSGHPALLAAVEPITTIAASEDWKKLDRLRGDYHRRRPQAALLDGVPMGSAWSTQPDGGLVLPMGTDRPRDHDGRVQDSSILLYTVQRPQDRCLSLDPPQHVTRCSS